MAETIKDERFEKIQTHLSENKKSLLAINDNVNEIKSCLVGNEFNGNQGIVHAVQSLQNEFLEIKKKQILLDSEISIFKWVVSIVFAGVVSFFFWLIQSKN